MLAWPADLPLPFAGGYAPFVRSLSGGQSLSGFEQVQPQLHDRWMAGFSFHLGTDARILALRSLLTRMRGRSNTVLLPAFDRSRAPVAVTSNAPSGSTIGDTFSDPPFWRRWPQLAGTAYEFSAVDDTISGTATVLADDRVSFAASAGVPAAGQYLTLAGTRREILLVAGAGPYLLVFRPRLVLARESAAPTIGTTVTATTAAAAVVNATVLDVTISIGAAPQPGHVFSVGTRLHAIDDVALLLPSSSTYRLTIWPWLRADVGNGAAVNFTSPACEMRFAADAEGQQALSALRLGKWGDVTLNFDEAAAT